MACRNGTLCTLRRGWGTSKTIAVLETQAVGILRREKTILVATMADSLVCFSSKGKRLWHVDMPSPIMCLEDLSIEARGVQFTAVALREGLDSIKSMTITYRVTHLLANLGWVDFDFGMFHHLAQLLSRFCQIPTSPSRVRQIVEQSKSKSTQPRFARRWVTLCLYSASRL